MCTTFCFVLSWQACFRVKRELISVVLGVCSTRADRLGSRRDQVTKKQMAPGYSSMLLKCQRVQSIPAFCFLWLTPGLNPYVQKKSKKQYIYEVYNHLKGNLKLQLIVKGVRQGYLHANRLSEDGAYRHLVLFHRVRRLNLRRVYS